MIQLDQATLNLRYAQAQEHRMKKLEQENIQLREVIEVMRQHLLSLKAKSGVKANDQIILNYD